MAKELLKREQVAVEDTWAIEDIYATEDAFLQDTTKVEKMSEELKKFTESYLNESGAHLLEYYKELEKIFILLDNVLAYAQRNADVDTANTHYQALNGKAETLFYKLQELTAPVESYIVAMDDAKINRFFREAPELENYRVSIEDLRRLKPHMLSSEMEGMLAASVDMGSAVDKVYSLLEGADFENPTVKNEKSATEDLFQCWKAEMCVCVGMLSRLITPVMNNIRIRMLRCMKERQSLTFSMQRQENTVLPWKRQ